MTNNKKIYTPVQVKPVVVAEDIVKTSEPTAATNYDPFENDIYFTEG